VSSRWASAVALATLAVLAALVALGRWERARQIETQSAGMRKVLRAIGPLDNATLAGFRVLPAFDCLTYGRHGNPLALEICVDGTGRVVEAIDRRQLHRRFWTLQFEPAVSPVRVDPAEVDRLLRKMEAE
jgi:hypothetical protein